MKRALVVIAALALTLTGCAAADAANTSNPDAVPAETSAEQTVAPLEAETPTAPASPEDEFLAYVRENLPANTVIPNATDEQLLAAGLEGCERRSSGEESDTISLIADEPQNGLGYYESSGVILSAASLFLCD